MYWLMALLLTSQHCWQIHCELPDLGGVLSLVLTVVRFGPQHWHRWWPGAHRASHQSGFGDRRGRDGSGSPVFGAGRRVWSFFETWCMFDLVCAVVSGDWQVPCSEGHFLTMITFAVLVSTSSCSNLSGGCSNRNECLSLTRSLIRFAAKACRSSTGAGGAPRCKSPRFSQAARIYPRSYVREQVIYTMVTCCFKLWRYCKWV